MVLGHLILLLPNSEMSTSNHLVLILLIPKTVITNWYSSNKQIKFPKWGKVEEMLANIRDKPTEKQTYKMPFSNAYNKYNVKGISLGLGWYITRIETVD